MVVLKTILILLMCVVDWLLVVTRLVEFIATGLAAKQITIIVTYVSFIPSRKKPPTQHYPGLFHSKRILEPVLRVSTKGWEL